MKIFFLMLHPGYTRNFESVISALVQRGHTVSLGFNNDNKEGKSLLFNFERAGTNVSVNKTCVPRRVDRWRPVLRFIYGAMDSIRYFDPRYDRADLLRQRVVDKVHPLVFKCLGLCFGLRKKWIRESFLRILGLLAEAAPSARNIEDFLLQERPDLLLVTPLVNFQSEQVEWIKSARQLKIPSLLGVASWDNLTNKGLIRLQPDGVFVWNEYQKQEAIDMHMVPPERVVVTGAQCFDKWFSMRPSTELQEFCKKVGFTQSGPFLLYVASSPFIAQKEKEVEFVREWVGAIRETSIAGLKDINILIRPHPQNAVPWRDVDFSEYGNVAIFPRAGANPTDNVARAEFYDSLYHSLAIVGLNTTAMIEGGILGKPVLTILDPRFKDTQEGTLHFHHLVREGLVDIAENFYEHIHQLEIFLKDAGTRQRRIRSFIGRFLRPHGLSKSATDIFVGFLEAAPQAMAPMPDSNRKIFVLKTLQVGLTVLVSMLAFGRKVNAQGIGKLVLLVGMQWGWRFAKRVLDAFGLRETVKNALIIQTHSLELSENGKKKNIFLCQQMQDIEGRLKKISKSTDAIVVGPWMSEVGFEVLYWIPFLHWVIEKYGIDNQRLLLVARGGSQPWYGGIGGQYIDVFDILSEEEFRSINVERWRTLGGQKQIRMTTAERELLEAIRIKVGLEQTQLLHPSMMYWRFRSFWRGMDSFQFYRTFTRSPSFAIPRCDEEISAQLPRHYVAVRFYFRPSFPDTPQNRRFVARLIQQLSKHHAIVMLNPPIKVDDHHDFDCDHERVYTISHLMTPRNNLEVQSAVIRRAQAFIGTYGGLSYVAPFYGVPSFSFYSDAQHFLPVHLETAQRIFRELGIPFFAMHSSHYESMKAIWGGDSCNFNIPDSLSECGNTNQEGTAEFKDSEGLNMVAEQREEIRMKL